MKRRPAGWLLCLLGLTLLVGCSDENPAAPADNHVHLAAWDLDHVAAASIDIAPCAACHGSDYRGSGPLPGCYDCHFGPDGARTPAGSSWIHGDIPHDTVLPSGPVCNACHQILRQAGSGPAACHDCHGGHENGANWLLLSAHAATSVTDRSACLSCHGMTSGGINGAPTCRSCHVLSNPPLSTGQCSSCHGRPPSGNAFPNRAGKHGDHNQFSCDICHSGAGSNSLNHWYPDPTAPADYNIDVTGFTYSGGRCSGTCHGESHDSNW